MDEIDQLFGTAVFANDAQTVNTIINEMGIDVDLWLSTDPENLTDQGKEWKTPLMLAATLNRKDVLSILLEAGSNVNLQSNICQKSTALHFACIGRHTHVIHKLLQTKQCEVNLKDLKSMTPLHLVAKRGSLATMKELIENKAEVNCIDDLGITALSYAAYNGCEAKVNFLLDNGADVNYGPCSISPLFAAAKTGHANVVSILLKHRIDLKVIGDVFLEFCPNSLELMKTILPFLKNINVRNKEGNTALHVACMVGNWRTVKLLLQYNCNTNCVNKKNYTPLYLACIHFHYRVVRVLLQAGCNPNVQSKSKLLLNNVLLQKAHSKNRSLIKRKVKTIILLVNAGYSLTNMTIKVTIKYLYDSCVPMMAKHKNLFENIQYLMKEPVSLQEICLDSIRTLLEPRYDKQVLNLEIPNNLKKWLLCENL